MPELMSFVGIAVILGLACLVSQERRRIDWRLVIWGVALQYIFAVLVVKTYPDQIFAGAQALFLKIEFFAKIGGRFLFGPLIDDNRYVILTMGSVIIFVSSMMAVLNFARVLPAVIYSLAVIMQRTMRTSGAETLAAAMFTMMGIEVVTGLKKVIGTMTRSELFTVMTCFLATIAGSVMAVYVGVFGANAGYILSASLMNAPAALVISKMLVPETQVPETSGSVQWKMLLPAERGFVEAAANGAIDGLRLVAAIGAILLAFVAIIGVLDACLGLVGTSFEEVGSYLFAPVAFILGVPWAECLDAGKLLALKVVFNEWLAYSRMKEMIAAGELSPRAVAVCTYALCSFANFGSVGILIGGISALAPDRKEEVIRMGMRALLSGVMAGFLTAAVAGTLIDPR